MKENLDNSPHPLEGIVLIDKPKDVSSFSLVRLLRKKTGIKKVGHAGTLDPFATGLMILLVGKKYTRQSDTFLHHDKSYTVTIELGKATSTYDTEGEVTHTSDIVPSIEEVKQVITQFQGIQQQVPPMFSAKKVNGKKLYELARKGIEIERKAQTVELSIQLINYTYPFLELSINCSKGTYIRSLAHDIGQILGCWGHATQLKRISSGPFSLDQSFSIHQIENQEFMPIKN